MIARTCKTDDEAVRRICRKCASKSVMHAQSYMRVPEYRYTDTICEVVDEKAFWYGYFGKKHFRLVELAVEAEHQRQGLGSICLQRIVEECSKRGIERITLKCSAEEGFAEFYVKHGATITGVKDSDYEIELRLEEYIG